MYEFPRDKASNIRCTRNAAVHLSMFVYLKLLFYQIKTLPFTIPYPPNYFEQRLFSCQCWLGATSKPDFVQPQKYLAGRRSKVPFRVRQGGCDSSGDFSYQLYGSWSLCVEGNIEYKTNGVLASLSTTRARGICRYIDGRIIRGRRRRF